MTARKQLDLPTDFIDLWFPVKKQKQKGKKRRKIVKLKTDSSKLKTFVAARLIQSKIVEKKEQKAQMSFYKQ